MKRCIGSAKPHRAVFRFFARYYDAEEVIHKRISWNWEDISNSGPKAMPKIMKNWTFNEKVYRIRKTSQKRFRLFARYYDAEEVIPKRISWNSRRYLQTLAPKLCQKLWKIEILTKMCIGFTEAFFAFLQDITMLKKWFISAFPEIEKISQTLAPKLCQKLWKIEPFNEKVHRIRKTSQEPFFAFLQDITMLKKWFISAFPELRRYLKLCPQRNDKNYKKLNL